jgi:hypothetical protein
MLLPSMPTLAKGTGWEVSLSIIFPEMVIIFAWEKASELAQKRRRRVYKNEIPFVVRIIVID